MAVFERCQNCGGNDIDCDRCFGFGHVIVYRHGSPCRDCYWYFDPKELSACPGCSKRVCAKCSEGHAKGDHFVHRQDAFVLAALKVLGRD